jgi:hypothetical protein
LIEQARCNHSEPELAHGNRTFTFSLRCGAIHLYTPAGLMETEWASLAQSEDPKDQEARKVGERIPLTLIDLAAF